MKTTFSVFCVAAMVSATLLAQWSDFSTKTGSKNLSDAMNSKPAIQSGAAAPSSNCTAGKDLYVETGLPMLHACDATNHWTATGVRTVLTTLTSANIIALNGTPITVVAAQGANTIIVPSWDSSYEFKAGSRGFGCSPSGSGGLNWSVGGVTAKRDTNYAAVIQGNVSAFQMTLTALSTIAGDISAMINQPLVVSTNGTCTFGEIATSAVNAGGTAYANGDTGTISGTCYKSGTPATYTVLTSTAGAVNTISVSSTAGYYAVTTGCATSATTGIGTLLTVNVNTINQGNGSAYVKTNYQVITTH